MLDHRYETFLALCRIRNYTKTAEHLNMTQPGVTQHIQFLEREAGGKLFRYRDRTLTLTPRGERLLDFASRLKADSLRAMELLRHTGENETVRFGATLTIGEYVMPPRIQRIHREMPGISLSMLVGNTVSLLDRLQRGEIQFALLEGFFDRSAYDSQCLRTEAFIGVCAPDSALARGPVPLMALMDQRLILRERGSGTREVLEHALMRANLTLKSFGGTLEIGNMSAIKQLVAGGLGISFMYRAAALAEIQSGALCRIALTDFSARHDFSFVTLKDSLHHQESFAWIRRFGGREGWGEEAGGEDAEDDGAR